MTETAIDEGTETEDGPEVEEETAEGENADAGTDEGTETEDGEAVADPEGSADADWFATHSGPPPE